MPKLTQFFKGIVKEAEEIKLAQKQDIPTVLKQDAKEDRFEDAHEFRNRMSMNDEDKLQSMRNAVMILPPNMVVDGRQTRENISAICGFKVTEEQWDLLYS